MENELSVIERFNRSEKINMTENIGDTEICS